MDERLRGSGERSGLLGRAAECRLLDLLIGDVRRSDSRSLVLRGEAGIGKTELLKYLIEAASDMTVVQAVGVESEMELAYASLHQLCAPLLDGLAALPVPQRRALEIVFGLSDGMPPDRFLVGLAVLSLISEAGEQRPILCAVDDAQWLDRASALTLGFVARRLRADPVGVVFAAREPGEELRHVPELEVRGLPNGDAGALLSTSTGSVLDESVRDRIIAEARGNPLALLELPRSLTPAELAGGFGLVEALPVPEKIEESFARRLDTLSADAQRLMLVAAAEPLGDPRLLLRAADQLEITYPVASKELEGLLALGSRVTFRHPLVRSAVYRAATSQERREAHRALAAATNPEADPDRRAWHLAAASAGPDEQVALELERSAGRAQARGGVAATAAFLERAVALTQDPARRPDRTLAAAQAQLQAGDLDAALERLAIAEDGPLDGFQRAQLDLLHGQIAFASGRANDAASMLLEAANRLTQFDVALARETYLTAWGAAVITGHLAGKTVIVEISHAIRALPAPTARTPLDRFLDGLALLTIEGPSAAAPTLRRAANALADIPAPDVLRWGWMAVAASIAVWDFDGMLAIPARQLQLVRDAGGLAQLPIHLSTLAVANAWMGDFAMAASLLAEEEGLVALTGMSVAPPYTALRLRALQGREAEALIAVENALAQASAAGQGTAATAAHWATAVLYNGLGRYAEAASAARQAASDTFIPWTSMFALPELVEAAARMGDAELARDALGRLTETTEPSGSDFALGIEARSRALLSDGTTADGLYREAIERLGRTRVRTELARGHLLYGEWLRRGGCQPDARAQLHAAYEQFTSIGMEAFAERARRELTATGEMVRKRRVATHDGLTVQERQIAQMAREGLSNAEIGARLFVSPRTVERQLRKIFRKVGIHSRR